MNTAAALKKADAAEVYFKAGNDRIRERYLTFLGFQKPEKSAKKEETKEFSSKTVLPRSLILVLALMGILGIQPVSGLVPSEDDQGSINKMTDEGVDRSLLFFSKRTICHCPHFPSLNKKECETKEVNIALFFFHRLFRDKRGACPNEDEEILPEDPLTPEDLFPDLEGEVQTSAFELAIYPNYLHEQLFGEKSTNSYPVYEIRNYSPGGLVAGQSYAMDVLDEADIDSVIATTQVTVLEVIFSGSDFDPTEFADEEPIDESILDENVLEFTIFFGRMASPPVEIVGVVLHVNNEDGEPPVTTMVVFREAAPYGYSNFGFGSVFSNSPPLSTQDRRKLVQTPDKTRGTERSPSQGRDSNGGDKLLVSVCLGFFQEALEQHSCATTEEQVRFNRQCAIEALGTIQTPLSLSLQTYTAAVEAAEEMREAELC